VRLFAAILFGLSAPAIAEPWKCELNHPDATVLTQRPFDVSPGQLEKAGFTSDNVQVEFQARVKAAYGIEFIHNYYGCGPAPDDWDDYLKKRPNAKLLDWKPSFLPGSEAGLTVEDVAPVTDAARDRTTYEQALLKAQRDEAAARAKQIADTARDRADIKAKIAKLFEEMRKRGRAQ
jgi:hypothetical protein